MKPPSITALAFSACLLGLAPQSARAQELLPYTLTQGSYLGSFVRVDAPTPPPFVVPDRGEVRLGLTPEGRINGVFVISTTGSGQLGYSQVFATFRGQIDPVSRRGFIKFTQGGDIFVSAPTEKIPVLLYPDGRLVGGSVDGAGGALAVRASFMPLTALPTPPSP